MIAVFSPTSIYLSGRDLDKMANYWGFKRKKYFWIFKESDRKLRERMAQHMRRFQYDKGF